MGRNTPTTTEPEPDPIPVDLEQVDELSAQDRECYIYVNVEAFALARCAQRKIKELPTIQRDQRKALIKKMSAKINSTIEKLQAYQNEKGSEGKSRLFVSQSAYICQSILLFEKYKLEETTIDLNQRIKQLLHILKHLTAFQGIDEKKSSPNGTGHRVRQEKMFARVYRNHLMVLMYMNADQLEIP